MNMDKKDMKLLENWDVVVLEDNPDNLEIAEMLLMRYGANVYTATNGAEGLELLTHVKPHFIISDLSMPVMNGWEFVAELKKDREFAEIPVIALTAHNLPGYRQQAIMEGFHNFMTKPLTIQTFVSDLLILLEDAPQIQDLLSSQMSA